MNDRLLVENTWERDNLPEDFKEGDDDDDDIQFSNSQAKQRKKAPYPVTKCVTIGDVEYSKEKGKEGDLVPLETCLTEKYDWYGEQCYDYIFQINLNG